MSAKTLFQWSAAALAVGWPLTVQPAEAGATGRKAAVLENEAAVLKVDLGGGAIGDFHLKSGGLNPLNWGTPGPGDLGIHGFGHFLCLDRWGPPSEAEGKLGMPYHGEAPNVPWTLDKSPSAAGGATEAQMTARLPKAGLAIRRTVRMSGKEAIYLVREEVTNENALGRVYNMVQHPTVGPPFLDESTVVDCNGRRGFAQGGSLPEPEEPSFFWPRALNRDGAAVNLRHLAGDPDPNVVSYAIDEAHGWVTAATPGRGVLIGYLWKTRDYPWVSLWRDTREGRPTARGLEFGSTGLHQPFPILTRKGRIWDRPTFAYLDAGETAVRSYTSFLVQIPADFQGVESIGVEQDRIVLKERRSSNPRQWSVPAQGLLP